MNQTTMKTQPTGLADALKGAIQDKGWSAYKAAQVAEVNEDSVNRFLKGERGLTLATFESLAHALGLELVPKAEPKP